MHHPTLGLFARVARAATALCSSSGGPGGGSSFLSSQQATAEVGVGVVRSRVVISFYLLLIGWGGGGRGFSFSLPCGRVTTTCFFFPFRSNYEMEGEVFTQPFS